MNVISNKYLVLVYDKIKKINDNNIRNILTKNEDIISSSDIDKNIDTCDFESGSPSSSHDFDDKNFNNDDIDTIIKLSNDLLISYIKKKSDINELEYINNAKIAQKFISLSLFICFWIIYKFIKCNSYIDADELEICTRFSVKEILEKELEILQTISYNIYPIFYNKNTN
jgi:hypothetical protein